MTSLSRGVEENGKNRKGKRSEKLNPWKRRFTMGEALTPQLDKTESCSSIRIRPLLSNPSAYSAPPHSGGALFLSLLRYISACVPAPSQKKKVKCDGRLPFPASRTAHQHLFVVSYLFYIPSAFDPPPYHLQSQRQDRDTRRCQVSYGYLVSGAKEKQTDC